MIIISLDQIKEIHMTSKINTLQRLPKEVWIGFLASFSEALNMALFPFLLPYLSGLIFHNADAPISLIYGYSILSIASAIAYPLGSYYFGYMGDKIGRKWSCTWSAFGLGIATVLIGFVPIDFDVFWVWILFLCANCLQYLFSGGEYYSVIIYSLEHSNYSKPGFVSGLSCLFAVLGLISAQALTYLSINNTCHFHWRWCFIIAGIFSMTCFFIKFYCLESPEFEIKSQNKIINIDHFRKNIARLFMILGLFSSMYAYIFIFLPTQVSFSPQNESSQMTSLVIYGLCLVMFGYFSDIVGHVKIMLAGITMFAFVLIVCLPYLQEYFFAIQILLTICAALFIGPIHYWSIKQFHPEERCRGVLIGGGIGSSVFFGITSPICLLLSDYYKNLYGTLIYIIPIICIGIVILYLEPLNSKKYYKSLTRC